MGELIEILTHCEGRLGEADPFRYRVAQSLRFLQASPLDLLAGQLELLFRSTKADQAGDIALSGFEGLEVGHELKSALHDALLHAIRNSLSHGWVQGATLKLAIRARLERGVLHVVARDNGRGPNFQSIAERALQRRLAPKSVLERFTELEFLELLFTPGFSTHDEVDELAGRGMGLDIIRSRFEELGGRVTAHRPKAGGFELRITVPVNVVGAETFLARFGDLKLWLRASEFRAQGDWITSKADPRARFEGVMEGDEPRYRVFKPVDQIWNDLGPDPIKRWLRNAGAHALAAAFGSELVCLADLATLRAHFGSEASSNAPTIGAP